MLGAAKWGHQSDTPTQLNKLCDRLYILALIEARLEDWLVLKVAEAEQLKATELMIVAQAELQAEVAVGPSHRLAFLLDVGSHLVKGHLQQALQTLSLRGAIFQYVGLNLAMSRRIDGLG